LAFDGSAAARRAGRWTRELAAARGEVEAEIVHALTLPPVPVGGGDVPAAALLDAHEREMRALAEEEREAFERAGVPAAVHLRRWLPAETLIERAVETGAGLIVLGQHGDAPRHVHLGSTSDAVARHATVPVAVVRGEARPAPPQRVLLALDGSAASEAAGRTVARWAPKAQVLAVTIHRDGEGLDADDLAVTLARLGLAPERTDAEVLEGEIAETLLDLAESRHADLVAVGRRGISRLREVLLGSVSSRLLDLSPCPVLVAH
jgi:nucleotide-binding universal stress UspA family protein